jgi:transcriptional regulator with XRE-family HTH domain
MQTMTSDHQIRANLSANLRRILAERQMSQSDLARLTGDPVMTVNCIWHGRNTPKVGVVTRIAEALDISLDRLTGLPPKKSSRAG